MNKYRINKAQNSGYNLYIMRDMGCGWSKEFHSHYETKEQAEQMVKKLQEIKSFEEK